MKEREDIKRVIDHAELFSRGNISIYKESLPTLKYLYENITILNTFSKGELRKDMRECINILSGIM